ncbi:MAG: 1-deoxy-D-xylulose-5-phosphate synthase [Clostridia bacterium]|nr:1-deoxy-D-xylulose-5-phosphate synthase [Clostridia bacterium]
MKLKDIASPSSIKALPEKELKRLASEIRAEIIRTVSVNGGHLASNLGAVELTIALHRVFDCPEDKLIFDVGHQCYTHKLLTGRSADFSTIRKLDGLCGFPRREESPYDAFNTGHASTAISAALGMARARDMRGENYNVVAVVGDGALTGGMCYEALNDAGSQNTPLMVVLNDNGMSISRNVGALSKQLTRLRVSRGWLETKKNVADALRRVPGVGEKLHDAFQRVKNRIRNAFIRDKFFTALGFQYFGPIDGHDIQGMERVFRSLKNVDRPLVVHVVTKKGSGFHHAEEKPDAFHGVAPFYIETGRARSELGPSVGTVGGGYITSLAENHPEICVVTAAMTESTGFGEFSKRFPKRLFDVGIAEEHAVTMAAGMAAGGMRPFVAIYETFLQRAFDQIAVDVCLQNLPVCFLLDRAGIGGEDGATHHGLMGVSMLRAIPNMAVLAPRSEHELKEMINWALSHGRPCAIRYPRSLPKIKAPEGMFRFGTWQSLTPHYRDVAILASSAILRECEEAVELLSSDGIEAYLINASTIQPLNTDCLKYLAQKKIPIVTVEEHFLSGGFGSAVAACCAKMKFPAPVAMIGLPDEFVPHGSRSLLLQRYGLDGPGIARQVKKAVKG